MEVFKIIEYRDYFITRNQEGESIVIKDGLQLVVGINKSLKEVKDYIDKLFDDISIPTWPDNQAPRWLRDMVYRR